MPVGASPLLAGLSYVAIGRETTFGTYNTCTAALDAISSSLKTSQDNKIIEQIERSRTYSKRISLQKKIAGAVEFFYAPTVDACNFLLQNAFGGTITSATATGETVGAGANSAIQHTFEIGMMDQSYPSLCVNIRKGDSTSSKIFLYSGVRINEISFSAEIDQPLKCNMNLIGLDSTLQSNDVSGALTVTSANLLSFVDGRISVETTFNSLTSSSFWHVVSCQFGWSNNLKSDAGAGRIGSAVLSTLSPGMAIFNLKMKIRFDTTTAWSAMINATKLSAQLDFRGPTFSSSAIRQGIRFNFPTIYVNQGAEPEISGPDQVLMTDLDFHVLRDDTTSTGYAVQAIVYNQKANYA